MRKFVIFAFLIYSILSCTQELISEIVSIEPPAPSVLRLSNQLDNDLSINSWSMVGYKFMNLDIPPGGSQQFILANGMVEGYKNLPVTIAVASSTTAFSIQVTVNFRQGGTTSIEIFGGDETNIHWDMGGKERRPF
jgi:hypothetical protein